MSPWRMVSSAKGSKRGLVEGQGLSPLPPLSQAKFNLLFVSHFFSSPGWEPIVATDPF